MDKTETLRNQPYKEVSVSAICVLVVSRRILSHYPSAPLENILKSALKQRQYDCIDRLSSVALSTSLHSAPGKSWMDESLPNRRIAYDP